MLVGAGRARCASDASGTHHPDAGTHSYAVHDLAECGLLKVGNRAPIVTTPLSPGPASAVRPPVGAGSVVRDRCAVGRSKADAAWPTASQPTATAVWHPRSRSTRRPLGLNARQPSGRDRSATPPPSRLTPPQPRRRGLVETTG
jgi:hypothetical protein